jgi:integrase
MSMFHFHCPSLRKCVLRSMAKKRSKGHQGLPARWRWKNGAYRYRVPTGQEEHWDGKTEFRLGATLPESYRTYAGRIARGEGDIQTFGQLIDRYLIDVTTHKSPANQREEILHLSRIREMIGHNNVAHFQSGDAYQMRDRIKDATIKGTGETYANRQMERVKHLLTKAIEWSAIREHPMTNLKYKAFPISKVKPQMRRAKSREAVLEVLPEAPKWLQNYVHLKLLTGLRMTDLLQLTIRDITNDGLLVHIQKTSGTTGRSLLFELTPELKNVLSAIRRVTPTSIYLFKTQTGQPLIKENGSTSAFSSAWRRWMNKLPEHERFAEKSLRNLVGSQDDLLTASERLGHASSDTTKKFYRDNVTKVTPLSS